MFQNTAMAVLLLLLLLEHKQGMYIVAKAYAD